MNPHGLQVKIPVIVLVGEAGMNKQEGVRKTAAGARLEKADTQLMGMEETRAMREIAAVVR